MGSGFRVPDGGGLAGNPTKWPVASFPAGRFSARLKSFARLTSAGTNGISQNVKTVVEKKTPGTLIVEKYRPRLNELTPAERRRLRQRAAELVLQP